MCAIFEFSDFAQKMWKKIRFKFEISEKIYKGFPCKKKILWDILYKMNSYQNYMDFLCKIFCRSTPINL